MQRDLRSPIVCSSDEGRILSSREEYAKLVKRGGIDKTYGGHGYDNDLVSMRAMFVGHGGRFKKGYIAKPFNNVDVYGLIAKILKIKPAPNDGDFDRVKKMLR